MCPIYIPEARSCRRSGVRNDRRTRNEEAVSHERTHTEHTRTHPWHERTAVGRAEPAVWQSMNACTLAVNTCLHAQADPRRNNVVYMRKRDTHPVPISHGPECTQKSPSTLRSCLQTLARPPCMVSLCCPPSRFRANTSNAQDQDSDVSDVRRNHVLFALPASMLLSRLTQLMSKPSFQRLEACHRHRGLACFPGALPNSSPSPRPVVRVCVCRFPR